VFNWIDLMWHDDAPTAKLLHDERPPVALRFAVVDEERRRSVKDQEAEAEPQTELAKVHMHHEDCGQRTHELESTERCRPHTGIASLPIDSIVQPREHARRAHRCAL